MLSYVSDTQFIPAATSVFSHPLVPSQRKYSTAAAKKPKEYAETTENAEENGTEQSDEFLDPLSALLQNGTSAKHNGTASRSTEGATSFADPLLAGSRLGNTLKEDDRNDDVPSLDPEFVGFRPWSELRRIMLQEFTTNDRFSMESSFLPTEFNRVEEKKRSVMSEMPNTTMKFFDLSQQEYIRKIRELRRILVHKWGQEKRLDCIKAHSPSLLLC
jgi:hypothetical protein